jgi:NADH-quinone oxidoreductase subunit J
MDALNWHSCFFLLFAILACGAAIAVALSSNIVRMAFYLIISLAATAGLFFLAGADFVGSMQIMIYVGGTLVLLVFGVMLTAEKPFLSIKTRGGEWLLAIALGGALLGILIQAALDVPAWRAQLDEPTVEASSLQVAQPTAARLGLGLLGVRVDRLGQPAAVGEDLAGYLLPFEIISVHLLVVLIAAAYLARPKRRATPALAETARE